jgi:hypothetical protein
VSKFLLFGVALPCSILAAAGITLAFFIHHLTSSADPTQIPAQEQPLLNPAPQYFMALQGHIDPALKHTIQLTWLATYYTFNPQCNVEVNQLEGVDSPLIIYHYFPVKPDAKGNYQLKIPLDKYMPGYCQWAIVSIAYHYRYKQSVYSEDTSTGVGFSSKQQLENILSKDDRPVLIYEAKPLNQTWVCGAKKCHLTSDSTIYIPYTLPDNRGHYLINVNFNKE